MSLLKKLYEVLFDPAHDRQEKSATGSRLPADLRGNTAALKAEEDGKSSKNAAYNRLKLVLMHDRAQLSPATLEQMRDDLVGVISKYVSIDRDAIELNLENDPETNTIALVANIPVVRSRELMTPIASGGSLGVTPPANVSPSENPGEGLLHSHTAQANATPYASGASVVSSSSVAASSSQQQPTLAVDEPHC